MDPLQFLVPLDWLDAVGEALPIAILVMAVANAATRHLAYRRHVSQASESDSLDQYLPHSVTTIGLLLLALVFTLVQPIGGVILSLLAITLVVADVFEFESRNVEARNGMTIERPKSAIVASLLVIGYAGYYGLFFVIAPVWNEFVIA